MLQVREMVPGAERKLREHQRLSTEYLVKHAGPSQRPQYDTIAGDRPKTECGPLLNKTPPDVCTTNKGVEFAVTDLNTSALISGVMDQNYGGGSLAGQTIPITIKNHNSTAPLALSYANVPPNKYGTIPHPGTTLHQGFLGVADIGSSSSNSSTGYCPKSKTLQHQRARKKCVKIETFQTPDTGFVDFSKRSNTLNYSGSAV